VRTVRSPCDRRHSGNAIEGREHRLAAMQDCISVASCCPQRPGTDSPRPECRSRIPPFLFVNGSFEPAVRSGSYQHWLPFLERPRRFSVPGMETLAVGSVEGPGQANSVMPALFAAPRSKVIVFSHPADAAEWAIRQSAKSALAD